MRLFGFAAGLTLGGLGLVFLANPPLATRARDVVVETVRNPLSPIIEEIRPTSSLGETDGAGARASSPVEPAANRADHSVDEAPLVDARNPDGEVADSSTRKEIARTPSQLSPGAWPGSESEQDAPSETSPGGEDSVATAQPESTTEARQWHAVWSPFLTARAARGFAERLATLTGLDFTVIEIGQGKHQVAFAFVDLAQRDTALAVIEGETGLELDETRSR